jgi:integrase/recombinase XerD
MNRRISIFLDSYFPLNEELLNEKSEQLLDHSLAIKDVWHVIDDLKLKSIKHNRIQKISFNSIHQNWLKLLTKLYVLVRSKRQISAATICNDISSINHFSRFIEQKSIFNAEQINNQLFDEFDCYLKSLNLARSSINERHQSLKNFFNLCREEGWLQVDTYWFKGKLQRIRPKNDEIEYIPEEVWQQLDEHMHYLPEPLQRMVVVIRGTGLRIGELLNLPLDCLRQRGKQWRLRLLTEKYQTTDELPICEALVIVIKEQQEYIKEHFGNSYDKLFNSNNGSVDRYIPAPRVMKTDTFNNWLNRLAKKQNICTIEGEVWHFRSHQFRRTLATIMTNAGVRDLIIQKYLRHRSPEMQDHYKRLLKEVLAEEYQELMKGTSYVDSTGKLVVAHQPQNPITELVRRKMHQITTQYGECHRPVLKSPCQTINACWQCEHWLTSTEDLSDLKQDLQRVETELDIAAKLGMLRQQQGLIIDRGNLAIRIKGLEKLNDKN